MFSPGLLCKSLMVRGSQWRVNHWLELAADRDQKHKGKPLALQSWQSTKFGATLDRPQRSYPGSHGAGIGRHASRLVEPKGAADRERGCQSESECEQHDQKVHRWDVGAAT